MAVSSSPGTPAEPSASSRAPSPSSSGTCSDGASSGRWSDSSRSIMSRPPRRPPGVRLGGRPTSSSSGSGWAPGTELSCSLLSSRCGSRRSGDPRARPAPRGTPPGARASLPAPRASWCLSGTRPRQALLLEDPREAEPWPRDSIASTHLVGAVVQERIGHHRREVLGSVAGEAESGRRGHERSQPLTANASGREPGRAPRAILPEGAWAPPRAAADVAQRARPFKAARVCRARVTGQEKRGDPSSSGWGRSRKRPAARRRSRTSPASRSRRRACRLSCGMVSVKRRPLRWIISTRCGIRRATGPSNDLPCVRHGSRVPRTCAIVGTTSTVRAWLRITRPWRCRGSLRNSGVSAMLAALWSVITCLSPKRPKLSPLSAVRITRRAVPPVRRSRRTNSRAGGR